MVTTMKTSELICFYFVCSTGRPFTCVCKKYLYGYSCVTLWHHFTHMLLGLSNMDVHNVLFSKNLTLALDKGLVLLFFSYTVYSITNYQLPYLLSVWSLFHFHTGLYFSNAVIPSVYYKKVTGIWWRSGIM
jgi:hypothetical protein